VAEAAGEIRQAAASAGYTERELHLAERGFDWSALSRSADTLSLFADRRVIEVRLPTGKPGDRGAATLVDLVERPDEDRLLLVVTGKLDGSTSRTRWVRALEKHGVWVQVWPLDASRLPGWIERRMKAVGLEPTRDAVALLAERTEGNLLAAQQEIEKLGLLTGSGPLDADAVLEAAADSARFDVFKLTDAALAGQATRAVRMLRALEAEGVEPVLVSWALARELRLLVTVSRARGPIERALEAARVWPRRRPLIKQALQRMEPGRLVELYSLAADTDRIIKGAAPGMPWASLTALVTGLAGASCPGQSAAGGR
jgi:DNA polymerase-3 subunit delta